MTNRIANLVASAGIVAGLARMGSKYLPDLRTQKARERFLHRQSNFSKVAKPTGTPPKPSAAKEKKK